jgi:predicted negative regulator of RcsB-dependent stress response
VAKPDSTQATETLHEIESIFDRLAHWVATNPVTVLLVLGVLLAGAAGIGGYQAWSKSRAGKASAEVAEIQAEYLKAMGAAPGALDVPEPANAEAAAATRREFAARFREAAERRSGTAAGVTAWLQTGDLLEATGDSDGAISAWRAAAESAPRGSALAGMARIKVAAGLEAKGDAAGAAAEYLAAGQSPDFPGRILALGDAARCFADAGQTERALEAWNGISPEDQRQLPPHIAARLAELRVRSESGR